MLDWLERLAKGRGALDLRRNAAHAVIDGDPGVFVSWQDVIHHHVEERLAVLRDRHRVDCKDDAAFRVDSHEPAVPTIGGFCVFH